MTDNEWKEMAKTRLISSGFELVFKIPRGSLVNFVNAVSTNNNILDYSYSTTTENQQIYIGVTLDDMTEAEFIMRYL